MCIGQNRFRITSSWIMKIFSLLIKFNFPCESVYNIISTSPRYIFSFSFRDFLWIINKNSPRNDLSFWTVAEVSAKQLVVTHITYETSTLPIRVIPRVEGVNSLRSWKRLNSLHNLRTNDDDKRRKIIWHRLKEVKFMFS